MEGVLVIKNVSVKLFSFFNGGSIGDQNVSAKFYSFFNGGSIGDDERVCQTHQFLQWRQYWWSRTCLSNSSASSMEGVLVMKNVSVKLFSFFNGGSIDDQNVSAQFYSFFNGGSIGDEERVCQTLQFLQWRQYWWSRTCLSNSSASSMEGVLVMKNVSVKLFSFFSGGSIGDQERVCQTLQLHQWREYWWWRTCLSNSSVSSVEALLVITNVSVKISASLMEGVLVMKNVSVKHFSFFGRGSVGDQENVCQTLELLYWREYWWSRTCLSNSSASLMEGVLVTKNVSVKLFSFLNGGSIGDEERVCHTLQFLHWRQYWWSIRCLSNSSASSMEGVLVMKNVSVKLFSFFSGGIIGDQERVCQNFSFINGGSIGDEERACQTLQLLYWRECWWARTCLSNSSASSMEGVLMIKNVSLKLVSFINWGGIGDEESACVILLLI